MSYSRVTEKLGWLFNRLSCMSVAEVFYRIEQLCTNKALERGLLSVDAPKPALQPNDIKTLALFDYSGISAKAYIEEADAILAGKVILFAAKTFNVGSVPEWNRDPLTGIVAPLKFGLSMPITNQAVVGDIKHLWELNRHLHLVRLAQAYVLTDKLQYINGLTSQISAWLEQCPPLKGANWSSSLEAAIRLINWALIWDMLGGWEGVLFQHEGGEQLRTRWLDSIFAHCQFICRHFSRHSSANNHLLGELAGLYVASKTWPYWPQAEKWSKQAKAELEREAFLQYSNDGVNREQAFAYQVFTLEFLIMAGVCGQRNADKFSDAFWQIVYKALHFLKAIRDVAGNTPMVGDADDGIVLRLEPGATQDRTAMILALGDALFQNNPALKFPDTVKWLAANTLALEVPDKMAASDWKFPDGGYFVFGSNFGQPDEIKGLLDCGPLGYLGIAAHGHADALALSVSIAGEQFLVDPGTFSYWNALKWREYFRGTSAHNTVRVDGVDQSVSGGRFMWTRKARTTIEKMPSSPSWFDFSGHHDGYMRLDDPVKHVRNVAFDSATKCLFVHDTVIGKTPHDVEQFWHFGPELKLVIDRKCVHVKGQRFKATMEFLGDAFTLQLDTFYGDEALPLGWFSSAYEVKQPIQVVRARMAARAVSIEVRIMITLL